MGVVFGWWLIETGSLLPCLLGHALFNLLPWVAARNSTGHSDLEPVFHSVWFGVFAVLGALFFGTGAWLLSRGFWRGRQRSWSGPVEGRLFESEE